MDNGLQQNTSVGDFGDNFTSSIKNDVHKELSSAAENSQKKKKIIKIFVIVGSALIFIAIVVLAIIMIADREKVLSCTSSMGSINIYYNNEKIIRYESSDVEFDLDGQNVVQNRMGIDRYIEEYSRWYELNTGEKCNAK